MYLVPHLREGCFYARCSLTATQLFYPFALTTSVFNIQPGVMPFPQTFDSFVKGLAILASLVFGPIIFYIARDVRYDVFVSCTHRMKVYLDRSAMTINDLLTTRFKM